MTAPETAFSTFESKWIIAHPEARIIPIFLTERQRQISVAFHCLIFELEQAAFFSSAAPQVSASKLSWWAEELTKAQSGQAQHPITQKLFAQPEISNVSSTLWRALLNGALSNLNEEETPVDLAAQLQPLENLYTPASQIEAQLLLGSVSAITSSSRLWAISTILRKFSSLNHDDKISVPLQFLARHQLTREQSRQNSPASSELFREYLNSLKCEIEYLLSKASLLNLHRVVRARLDLHLIQLAHQSRNPLQKLAEMRSRPSWQTVWYAWRAARQPLSTSSP